jgi:hypothetical protein
MKREIRYTGQGGASTDVRVYNRYTGEERYITHTSGGGPGDVLLLDRDEVLWPEGEPKRIEPMPLFRRLQKWLMGG